MLAPILFLVAALVCFLIGLAVIYIATSAQVPEPFQPGTPQIVNVSFVLWIALNLAAVILLCVSIGVFVSRIISDADIVLSSPALVPIMILVGIGFYRLRFSSPILYGMLECCFGIIAISLASYSTTQDVLAKLLGAAGGVYIIVRGLDNIDRGLTNTWRTNLKLIFPQRTTTSPKL
jgi:hypothetical protein